MHRLFFLTVVLGLGRGPLAWCDAPIKTAANPPAVEQLIEQLADKDFRVRDQASKAIAALGTEVLPALQKGRTNPDPEVRRRLDELIPPLERAILLMPKRVTLHMTNKPLKEVIAELAKQTGYKILGFEGQPNSDKDKTVYTFHFDKLPFWAALDKICEASGMVLQQNYGEDGLRLSYQDSYVPYVHYDGPFKVIAAGFNYYRNNNFGQLPKNPVNAGQYNHESLNFTLNIGVEPKLPLLRVGGVKLTLAEDDEKHSMLPVRNGNGTNFWEQRYYGWSGYRSYFQQTQATLLWPSKTSKTVKILKGTVPITLLADQKPSVVTDKILAAKGKYFKVGTTKFNIEDVSEMAGKQYQIKMSVTEENKDNPQDYSRIQSLQQRLELQDDKGNKHSSYMNFVQFGGPSNAQFTLTTQPAAGNAKLGPPTKLVYYAWVLMEHEVAFEFRDLPLP
jgi:hypothetical protein